MFTFLHVTEATFDKKPANLPQGAKLSERQVKVRQKDGTEVMVTKYYVHLSESLTVPTTTDDLIALAKSESEEVEMKCGETQVKMTQACADYVRGRKLRSNQDRQQELRSGVGAQARGDALAFWSKLEGQMVVATESVIKSIRDKSYAKVHNAKLDRIAAAMLAGDTEAATAAAIAE